MQSVQVAAKRGVEPSLNEHTTLNNQKLTMKFLQPNQYQPEISRLYEKIANELRQLVPNAKVDHIGASAIRGAISKGDLDIFVGVAKARIEYTISKLERKGYRVKPNTLRNESLCMLENDSYRYPVALQVVANGSRFEMFLAFRDVLRKSEALLREYNQKKYLCEGISEDCYRSRKSEFIEKVLSSLQD